MYTARTTTCTFQVLYRCLTFWWLIFLRLCCLINQRYSLCPHWANSYRLTWISKQTQRLLQLQYNSTHSHNSCKSTLWHTSDTVGQNTGTQPQLTTSLFQVHHHPYLHHLTWDSILRLVVDSSHHFSLRDRNTPRPREQTPRISDRLINIYQHLFTSTVHLICKSPRSHHFWHNTLLMRAGVRCVVVAATPPSPWDVPAITQPQGNRGFFRHTQPDQGTDDTTHWGSKQERGRSLSQILIQLVSTFLGWTQHDMTTSWTSMATHSWTAMTAHRHADIPDDLLSSTRCLFTLQLADS